MGYQIHAVVNAITHIDVKPPRLTKQRFVAGAAAAMPVAGGVVLGIRPVSTITAHSSSPEGWPFTSRQPMRSGATCSAGRQKKNWGRYWESVVAMGVAL
jgi:hypothetical protein